MVAAVTHTWRVVCRKLSAEELERKRREMMDEAKQREEDRENNVKRYKRQDEQERQREQNGKRERNAGFIQWVFVKKQINDVYYLKAFMYLMWISNSPLLRQWNEAGQRRHLFFRGQSEEKDLLHPEDAGVPGQLHEAMKTLYRLHGLNWQPWLDESAPVTSLCVRACVRDSVRNDADIFRWGAICKSRQMKLLFIKKNQEVHHDSLYFIPSQLCTVTSNCCWEDGLV